MAVGILVGTAIALGILTVVTSMVLWVIAVVAVLAGALVLFGSR
jgi:cytochrome c-type biogenesis protein CcmH/NrfF